MADASITLYRGSASTTAGTVLYTSPSNIAVTVTNVAITNTTTAAVTATLNLATVALVSSLSVPGNSTQFIDMDQVIYNGETITGSASTTAVNFHISGNEIY